MSTIETTGPSAGIPSADNTSSDSPEGLRERKKQQTRRAIHDAAFRLVDEYGLEGTTIDQICAEADISPRTFFNYFPSKIAAAIGLPAEGIGPETVERFRAATGSLVDALCDVVTGSGQFAVRHGQIKSLMSRHPELMPELGAMMATTRGRFVELARERARSDEEATCAVTLVMAAVQLTMHGDASGEMPMVDRVRSTVDALVGVRDVQLSGADV